MPDLSYYQLLLRTIFYVTVCFPLLKTPHRATLIVTLWASGIDTVLVCIAEGISWQNGQNKLTLMYIFADLVDPVGLSA